MPTQSKTIKKTHSLLATKQTHLNYGTRTNSSKERQDLEIKKPKRYQVLLHNDDVTPMEFVVDILYTCFFKAAEESNAIMLKAHREGKASVGIYSYDVAKSKVEKARRKIDKAKYPLEFTIEPV